MKKRKITDIILAICFFLVFSAAVVPLFGQASTPSNRAQRRSERDESQRRPRRGGMKTIELPDPAVSSSFSLEEAISKRRSVRQFMDKPLSYAQIGQLCWAGQGITDKGRGLRAAPSAWAVYPIELYLVTFEGLFVYRPEDHSLEQIQAADLRKQLSAAVGQPSIAEAACNIIVAGSVRKLSPKAGSKAGKFLNLEAGHVAENIQLQAVSLGLASVPVGDFEPRNVGRVCALPGEIEPLLIVCVGYPVASQGKPAAEQKALLIVPEAEFRDEELFETVRVLNEAGIATVVASTKIGPLKGVLGGIVASEVTLEKVQVADYDAVIFIDGPGAVSYFDNTAALGIAKDAATQRRVIGAINLAPAILANAGILNGLRATGYLTQRELIRKAGANYTGVPVERDGYIITASSPSAVVPFARAIVGAIKEKRTKLE